MAEKIVEMENNKESEETVDEVIEEEVENNGKKFFHKGIDWVKDHKKTLITTGIAVLGAMTGYALGNKIKKDDTIDDIATISDIPEELPEIEESAVEDSTEE